MKTNKVSDLKILIVDDQPLDIVNLKFLSWELGINPALAFDGTEAWQMASKEPFDLIILDWHMPVMPGWVFLDNLERALADSHRLSSLCKNVILHTAEPFSHDDFMDNSHVQILDIWQKPMSIGDLMKKMSRLKQKIGA